MFGWGLSWLVGAGCEIGKFGSGGVKSDRGVELDRGKLFAEIGGVASGLKFLSKSAFELVEAGVELVESLIILKQFYSGLFADTWDAWNVVGTIAFQTF